MRRETTDLPVCGLNMVGCSSSIAEKKSAMALLASGLAPSADVEASEFFVSGWGEGAVEGRRDTSQKAGTVGQEKLQTLWSATTRRLARSVLQTPFSRIFVRLVLYPVLLKVGICEVFFQSADK